ncbi:MAG: NUDIX domain-containing protein [Gemmatimonadales bacterium]
MPKKSSQVRTITQTSAGGAALRRTQQGTEVALVSVGNPPRWQLPKGLIEPGETPEQAAVREVREEAGITARPERLMERVEYWYQARQGGEKVRYHKFVHFFLMWYESGDVADHDHEVHESRWFPVNKAISDLAFRSERAIVEVAVKLAGGEPVTESQEPIDGESAGARDKPLPPSARP